MNYLNPYTIGFGLVAIGALVFWLVRRQMNKPDAVLSIKTPSGEKP